MNHPEIKDLSAALGLKRSGCFVGAAKELGITQPAVSGRIAKLEQSFAFPLFHRRPGETTVTSEGHTLFPLIEEVDEEFSTIIRKLSYWRRVNQKEVNILVDGSELAKRLLEASSLLLDESIPTSWFAIEPNSDLLEKLESYEVDLLVCGSFLEVDRKPNVQVEMLIQQNGLTAAWNPSFYGFSEDDFNLRDLLSSTAILPQRSMALGFRRFLESWCLNTYRFPLTDILEAPSADVAIDLCAQGCGVLLLPGDAARYWRLKERGFHVRHCFDPSLPNAFDFGIRYRANEKNPAVLNTVQRLSELSDKLYDSP